MEFSDDDRAQNEAARLLPAAVLRDLFCNASPELQKATMLDALELYEYKIKCLEEQDLRYERMPLLDKYRRLCNLMK